MPEDTGQTSSGSRVDIEQSDLTRQQTCLESPRGVGAQKTARYRSCPWDTLQPAGAFQVNMTHGSFHFPDFIHRLELPDISS